MRLPEIGERGQHSLQHARVLLVGAGGLGCPAALYLVGAGVGMITVADGDRVAASNLHRQVAYRTSDVGRLKAEALRENLRELNPDVDIRAFCSHLDSSNAPALIANHDLVADATDTIEARYLLSDACVATGVPLIHASVHRFTGQLAILCAPNGPCYRCIHPTPPLTELVPSCSDIGVVGPVPGTLGVLLALEVIKVLVQHASAQVPRLHTFDLLAYRMHSARIERDPLCIACGDVPAQPPPLGLRNDEHAITAEVLASLANDGTAPQLIDVRELDEWDRGNLADRGALHIPLGELAARAPSLEKTQMYVIYCERGPRSLRAVRLLFSLGFADVAWLRGGYSLIR